MTKRILVDMGYATIYDDHTYRYNDWNDKDKYSNWKLVDGKFNWQHSYMVGSGKWHETDPGNKSYDDQWASKIMNALVEREIFGE